MQSTGLEYKDMDTRIKMRMKNDHPEKYNFDNMKRTFKALYTAYPIVPPLLLSHLTPNRNIREYNKAIQINAARYTAYYFEIIEHVIKRV